MVTRANGSSNKVMLGVLTAIVVLGLGAIMGFNTNRTGGVIQGVSEHKLEPWHTGSGLRMENIEGDIQELRVGQHRIETEQRQQSKVLGEIHKATVKGNSP